MRKQDRNVRIRAFRYDGDFYTYTAKIFDLVAANVLWLIGSLPVATAGASFCALYHVVVHSVRSGERTVFKEFWRVYRRDLKQSLAPWCFALAMYFVLFLNLGILREQTPSLLILFFIVLFVFVLAGLTVVCCYLFPAIATFAMPTKWQLRLALYLSIKHLPLSLLLIAMFAALYFSMLAVPLLVLALPSVFALFSSFLLEPVLAKHMPKDNE